MEKAQQRIKAERFRELHHGPGVLILVNIWDVASARIVEEAGFPALATTSGGVAAALGYPDGEYISRREMLEMIERIARAVRLPVSADLEAGYGRTPEEIAKTARELAATGAIGMNLEDSTRDPHRPLAELPLQVEKVHAIREVADSSGIPIVLNARTDVYLSAVGDPAGRLAETVRRANAYREAGADCLFVPGVRDAGTIAVLAREIHGPLNILAGPGTPPVPELERLGVKRVSLGSGPYRACLTLLQKLARELLESGTYAEIAGALSHDAVNQLLVRS